MSPAESPVPQSIHKWTEKHMSSKVKRHYGSIRLLRVLKKMANRNVAEKCEIEWLGYKMAVLFNVDKCKITHTEKNQTFYTHIYINKRSWDYYYHLRMKCWHYNRQFKKKMSALCLTVTKKANCMLWIIRKRTKNKPENITMPPYNLVCTLPF